MKQQNYIFLDIVSALFLLVLLVGNFMGILYITNGNMVISLLISMFIVVCYYFTMELLKKNKELMLKNKFLHPSLLFWFFFLVLGGVSFTLMSHFINVEYNVKPAVQKEAALKLNLVSQMKDDYVIRANEDIMSFDADLKTMLQNYKKTKSKTLLNELATSPYNLSPNTLQGTYMNVIAVASNSIEPYQLVVDANIKMLDSTIQLNNTKFQSIFDNWNRLSIAKTYANLNTYVDDNLVEVNNAIAQLPMDKTPLTVNFNRRQIPLNSPSDLKVQYKPDLIAPLLVIIGIHIFLLIPFFGHKVRGYSKNATVNRTDNDRNTRSNQGGTIEI